MTEIPQYFTQGTESLTRAQQAVVWIFRLLADEEPTQGEIEAQTYPAHAFLGELNACTETQLYEVCMGCADAHGVYVETGHAEAGADELGKFVARGPRPVNGDPYGWVQVRAWMVGIGPE